MHKLGIDIGRVIMAPTDTDGRADTSFLSGGHDAAMRTPPSEGAFACIRELVEIFEGRIWLVSKCGDRIQKRSKDWLRFQDFYRQTGVPRTHLRFCKRRQDKRIHANQLKLTHFIDDRIDVLRHLRGRVQYMYLFGNQKPGAAIPDWVRPTLDWAAVMGELRGVA